VSKGGVVVDNRRRWDGRRGRMTSMIQSLRWCNAKNLGYVNKFACGIGLSDLLSPSFELAAR
jgi:hypothetical protein